MNNSLADVCSPWKWKQWAVDPPDGRASPLKNEATLASFIIFLSAVDHLMRSVSAYVNCSFSSWRPWNMVPAQRNAPTCVFTATPPPWKKRVLRWGNSFSLFIYKALYYNLSSLTVCQSYSVVTGGFLFWKHNHPSHVWWWWGGGGHTDTLFWTKWRLSAPHWHQSLSASVCSGVLQIWVWL